MRTVCWSWSTLSGFFKTVIGPFARIRSSISLSGYPVMTTIGKFGIDLLGRFVNIVGWAVRQFQIEKEKIELLLFERGDRFFHRADDDAAEADLLQENLEQILQTLVVIDHQDGWLTGTIFLQNILVERILLDAPTAADLDGGQLAALNQIINSRQRNSEILRSLLDRQEVVHGREGQQFLVHGGKTYSLERAL